MKKKVAYLLMMMVFVTGMSGGYAPAVAKKKDKQQIENKMDYINAGFWSRFTDPQLNMYVEKAVKNNHDLKIASIKTLEYKQQVNMQLGAELPTLSILGNYARLKTPAINIDNLKFDSASTNIWAVPLVMTYEADIFLKNRDKTRAMKKQYEMAVYQEKATYISLVSAVATTYLNIVQLNELVKLQKDIVIVREKICSLTKDRHEAGLASLYDVVQTDKAYTASKIMLNDLEKNRIIALNQLAVLIGESPENIADFVITPMNKIEYGDKVPDSISSDILVKRPDIMKAEAALQKAKIDIRVARKEFLPSIPIVGAIGYSSTSLSSLFDWKSTLGLIAVAASQDLFAGGRKIANLKMKKHQYEELFEAYKKADLEAIQEVNDSLAKVKFETRKDTDNKKKLELERRNFRLIEERYRHGVISYLDMMQYKENLLSVQKETTASKTQRLVSYLSLYKAAGANL